MCVIPTGRASSPTRRPEAVKNVQLFFHLRPESQGPRGIADGQLVLIVSEVTFFSLLASTLFSRRKSRSFIFGGAALCARCTRRGPYRQWLGKFFGVGSTIYRLLVVDFSPKGTLFVDPDPLITTIVWYRPTSREDDDHLRKL